MAVLTAFMCAFILQENCVIDDAWRASSPQTTSVKSTGTEYSFQWGYLHSITKQTLVVFHMHSRKRSQQ